MNRRAMMGLLGAGGLPRRRPDQQYRPGPQGVSPGARSGIFFGRRVVIVGPGKGSGLFVYNGAPALGNPPVFSVVAPGVTADPYGNAVAAVVQAGVPGTGLTQINQAGDVLLSGADGSQVMQFSPSHQRILIYADPAGLNALIASIALAGGTDTFGNNYLTGIASYIPGGPPSVFCQITGASINLGKSTDNQPASINGSAGDLFLDAGQLTAADVIGRLDLLSKLGSNDGLAAELVSHQRMQVQDSAGNPGYVFTVDPNSPGNDELYHTWPAFQNGWTTAARAGNRYRLVASPPQTMEIVGSITVPAGFAANQVITNFAVPYRPANSLPIPCRNLTNNGTVWLQLGSAGNLTFQGSSAAVAAADTLDVVSTLLSLSA